MLRTITVFAMAGTLLAGCVKSDEGGNNRDTMTQRQKDSVLGQSGIAGAQGVTKAMRAADSAKAHQAHADSVSPP